MEYKNKNLEVGFILLCDYGCLTDGGKLAAIGIFDIVGAREFPTNHIEMFIISQLKGENNSEHEIKVRVKDPKGNEVVPQNAPSLKIKLSGTGLGNVIQRLLNFPLSMPGQYTFSLYEGENELASTPLTVMGINNQKGKVVS